jgi:hypothetical protein
MVANVVYINTVLMALDDILLFSLYSFCSIPKQVMTLTHHRRCSFLDSLEMNIMYIVLRSNITLLVPVSPKSDPAHYTRLSLTLMC